MQLFVMRHGQASLQASSDAQRPLNEQGHIEAITMAKWLNDTGRKFDHLYVSPYLRAQQTAKTLSKELSFSAQSTTIEFITPSGNANEVHDFIDGTSNVDQPNGILIVSHMPLVSYLVAELTFDNRSPIFPTAGIAQIDYDISKMKGELVDMKSPYDFV